MKECILSITTSGHGVGCSLCIKGQIVGATTLERITRKKYDILLPITKNDLETFGWLGNPNIYQESLDLPFDLDVDYSALDFNEVEDFQRMIDYVLSTGGVDIGDVDTVTYSYRYNENVKKYFTQKNRKIEFIVPEHHLAHACQAFLPSPFEDAAIMIVDGQGVPLARTGGDQLSGCLAYGKGNKIDMLFEFPVRHSLGGLYSYITKICGFKTNEECKTMGLASYGSMDYFNNLKKEIKFETTELDLRNIIRSLKSGTLPAKQLYSFGRIEALLRKYKPRAKDEQYSDIYTGIAQAGQKIVEEVMIYLADWLHEKTGSKNLCIAGGVGLNCVANYQVLSKTKFDNIFVYPNAGDNGLPVGQSLYAYTMLGGNNRSYISTHDYLGKQYTPNEVRKAVDEYRNKNVTIKEFQNMQDMYKAMAKHIADGNITSWWQGRSEYGPRALGNRSILADPRRKDMKDILNLRVKFRENFRPFTPSVLKERANEFFTLDIDSPYMLLAPYVQPGKADIVPSITHVDNTARVQTVTRDVNERYYDLIKAFEKITGVPVLLNTSFNVAGEPIVETPEDAIKCFLSTDIDILGIDNFMIMKEIQPKHD